MQIVNSSIYLGVSLGPTAGACFWTPALSKFKARVQEINQRKEPILQSIRSFNSRAFPVLSHLAQLAPPPKNLLQIEMAALSKVTHMATSALTHDGWMSLNVSCGLPIVAMTIKCQACRFRASHKTLANILELHRLLYDAARNLLPLRLSDTGHHNPIGWDSLPLIKHAHDSPSFSQLDNSARNLLLVSLAEWRSKPNSSLQAKFQSALVAQSSYSWTPLMCKRLKTLCPKERLCPRESTSRFFAAIQPLPLASKIMAIRTLCNAWTTSDRYHEKHRLHCIFGCGLVGPLLDPRPKDVLVHYLECPGLWGIIAQICGVPTPEVASAALCLTGHSNPAFIVLAHSIYHGLKQGHPSLIRHIYSLRSLNRVLDVAHELGCTAWSDLQSP